MSSEGAAQSQDQSAAENNDIKAEILDEVSNNSGAESAQQVDSNDVAKQVVAPQDTTEQVSQSQHTPPIDLSSKFAELKRKEKELRAQSHQSKSAIEQAKQQWIDELKANPLEALQQYGVSADVLTNAILGDGNFAGNSQAKEEKPVNNVVPKELQEKLDMLEQERNQRLVADFQKDRLSELEKSSDEFELLLNSPNGKDLFWAAIEHSYKTYGDVPDYLELAKEVENALLEEGKRLLALNKFKINEVSNDKVKLKQSSPQSSQPTKASDYTTISKDLVADNYESGYKVEKVAKKKETVYRGNSLNGFLESQTDEIINKYLKG